MMPDSRKHDSERGASPNTDRPSHAPTQESDPGRDKRRGDYDGRVCQETLHTKERSLGSYPQDRRRTRSATLRRGMGGEHRAGATETVRRVRTCGAVLRSCVCEPTQHCDGRLRLSTQPPAASHPCRETPGECAGVSMSATPRELSRSSLTKDTTRNGRPGDESKSAARLTREWEVVGRAVKYIRTLS
jgi:hypothetical protein